MKPATLRRIKTICLIVAICFIAVPAIYVGITNNGFGPVLSKLLITASAACLILFTMLGIKKDKRYSVYCRIGVSIGIAISVVSIWF